MLVKIIIGKRMENSQKNTKAISQEKHIMIMNSNDQLITFNIKTTGDNQVKQNANKKEIAIIINSMKIKTNNNRQ